MTKLTDAQRKTLLFLPRDGTWFVRAAGDHINLAADNLPNDLVETQFGSAGSYFAFRHRLTPAGMAARKELEKGG